jgi:trehalose-6-phosphate synthase
MEKGLIEKVKNEHKGEWIGVKDEELVITSESHRELYKKLKEKKISGVYVFYSPTEKEKKYGFLFQVDEWR